MTNVFALPTGGGFGLNFFIFSIQRGSDDFLLFFLKDFLYDRSEFESNDSNNEGESCFIYPECFYTKPFFLEDLEKFSLMIFFS